MKIVCVSTSRVPASTANSIQVMKVCQSLVQTGADVTLLVPGKAHVPWSELAPYYGLSIPFETRWLPSAAALKRYDFAFQAVNQAIKLKADLLYTWLPQAAVIGLRRGLPVVLEVHDRPTGKLGPWLLRKTVELPGRKRLALITRALYRVIQEEFGIRPAPQEVVIAPNGVDLERYQGLPDPTQARRQLGLPERTTAVYAGHFYPGRGMELLFELARAFPRVQFLWVGGNPESVADWRERIAAAGLENITLTGFIENRMLPLYQAAGEILLMPYERSVAGSSGGNSADICSPMKMFEYLACGRVILSSDLAVLHEILNEENAVFCPPEEPEGWRRALDTLLAEPERMRRLGAAARSAAEKYTWQRRAERILAGFIIK
jgi:glycosyltransferase involved in cell wall biosynthesis